MLDDEDNPTASISRSCNQGRYAMFKREIGRSVIAVDMVAISFSFMQIAE
jgi:hypothetical protein